MPRSILAAIGPLFAGLLFALLPLAAGAVSVSLSGPSAGALTSGVGSEPATDPITFEVALDPETGITGYDLTIAWDSDELTLTSVTDASVFNLSTVPAVPVSTGTRVTAFAITATDIPTTVLFSLTFSPNVPNLVADGVADVRVWLAAENGPGLSALAVPPPEIDNIDGVDNAIGFDVVPEPTTAMLLAMGLAGLATRRLRRDS